MRRLACCVLVLTVTSLATMAPAERPVAVYDESQPGLDLNFDDGTSDFTDYGVSMRFSDDDWTFADGQVTSNADETYARLRPGMKGDHGQYTAMSDAQDWVFSVQWTNNVSTHTTIFELGSEGGDIAVFKGRSDDEFELGGAEPGARGSYPRLWSGTLSTGVERLLTVHYKTATQKIDFYIDDDLIMADFGSVSGNYQFNFVQLLGGAHSPPGETFDDVKIGLAGAPPECGPGDADGDGDVDDDDLSLLLANWGADTDCAHGEFSSTPPVNDDDLSLLLANWTGALPAAVPEPATVAILMLGTWALRRRRS